MDYDRRFPVDVALAAVGLDAQRFKDAVAKGHYPCAPETVRGARRMFGEADLLALAAFAILTDEGVTYQIAGHLACHMRQRVGYDETREGLTSVHFIRLKTGEQWIGPWYGPGDTRMQLDPTGPGAVMNFGVTLAAALERANMGLKKQRMEPIEL
jgi:hypothetical protein